MHKILAFSDLHFGSNYGLWPKGFEYEDKKNGEFDTWNLNSVQKELWKIWKYMIDKAKDCDIIIANGDLIDGPQKKGWGKGVKTPDLSIQLEACEFALSMLPDVPMYFTQGTEYHTVAGGIPAEQQIAKDMGWEENFGDDLCIDECGIRTYAKHHVPTTKSVWMYRPTPLARDLMLLALSSAPNQYGVVDLMCCSHAHYKCGVTLGGMTGIITPGFQTRTPYAAQNSLITPPDVGFCIIEVEDGIGKHKSINPKFYSEKIGRPCKVVGREAKCQPPQKIKRL